MTLPLDPRPVSHGQPYTDAPEPIVPDDRAAVSESVGGSNVQVLELRGTIIRLREQLDRIHAQYEEKVQRLESLHRSQCRELEETIRHLRKRLQACTGAASDG